MAYVVQAALGGHSIPVDAGTLAALRVLDLVTDKEAAAGEVPGMERAVAKSKGVEFGSLLHQLGADYLANPFSPQVREILLAIDPEAAKRFPQRRQPRPEPPPAPEARCRRSRSAASRCRRTQEEDRSRCPGQARGRSQDGRKQGADEAQTAPKARPAGKAKTRPNGKAAETKPAEGKKAVGSASKKAAESAHESPAPEKQHDKPPKAEKAEKGRENTPKAEKQPEKAGETRKAIRGGIQDPAGRRWPRQTQTSVGVTLRAYV